MKVQTSVIKSILEYPTLYARYSSIEEAKNSILHHMFIVLGNGIEWAHTKNPNKGGYLIAPSYYNKKRKYDPPYDSVKISTDIDVNSLFNQKIYTLYKINHIETFKSLKNFKDLLDVDDTINQDIINRISIKTDYIDKNSKFLYTEYDIINNNIPKNTLVDYKDYNNSFTHVLTEIVKDDKKFELYPSFNKSYSIFYEMSITHPKENALKYIQDDWREEAINHLIICKDRIDDIKSYTAINDKTALNTLEIIKKGYKKNKNIFNEYYFEPFDVNSTESFQNALDNKHKKEYDDNLSFIEKTIEYLLKK